MTHPKSLKSIAFFEYLKYVWKNSGAVDQIIESNNSVSTLENNTTTSSRVNRSEYNEIIQETLLQLIENEFLPKSLKSELGNCLLDLSTNMANFCSLLSKALEKPTKDNMEHAIRSIVVTPNGVIDKKKSIIEMAFRIDSVLSTNFTAYHCVSLDEVLQILRERQANNELLLGSVEDNLRKSFIHPYSYWESRHRMAVSNIEMLECVTLYGGKEALEYHLSRIDPDQKQAQLSKAAQYMMRASKKIDSIKLLYFNKEMEQKSWQALLQRYFLGIFTKIFADGRYRHLCVDIYSQVQGTVELYNVKSMFDFLSQQNMIMCKDMVLGPLSKKLLLDELEPIFLAIWRMTAYNLKNDLGHLIYKIIDRFLLFNKFNLIAKIIQEELFPPTKKYQLAHYAIMKILIMHGNLETVDKFIDQLDKKKINAKLLRDTIIKSTTFFKLFIVSDGSKSTDKYDNLLSLIGINSQSIKKSIIMDKEYMKKNVYFIKRHVFTVESVENLLKWCFSHNRSEMKYYIETFLLPENLITDMFKHHLTSNKQSIFSIRAFDLSLQQRQEVCKAIARDTKTLFRFCHSLVRSKDFTALPKMLACVFETDEERLSFLRSFFRSSEGTAAVHLLLGDEAFDDNFFSRCTYRNKLSLYVIFQKYFVLSSDISNDLQRIVTEYSPPVCPTRYYNSTEVCNLLPHESVENFRRTCDANTSLFSSLLTNNLLNLLISHEVHM